MNPAPTSQFQRNISIKEESLKGFVKIMGYVDRIDSKGTSSFGGTPDQHFAEYLRTKSPPTFDSSKYCITKDTHYNTNLSVLKYDRRPADKCELDPELYRLALEDTIQWYSFLKDRCKILDWEEVEYVPDTSPGVKFRLAGCSTKEDALDRYEDYIKSAWNTHHVRKIPCLWKQAGKVELLKREKVDAGDLRGFTCPELDFLVCCIRMNSDFNKQLHSHADKFNATMSRVGYILQRGGFTRLFKRHDRPNVDVGEGDCVKYDANIGELFCEISKEVRFQCWDKKGMSSEEWYARQDWYFENKCYSFILLPSGQIVMTVTGNKSGQDSTTDDNGIAHTFVLCYGWRQLFGISLYSVRDTQRFDLYADDHGFSVTDPFRKFSIFEVRAKIYSAFGLELSQAKDLVTQSVEGHTFLGPKAKIINGRIVPIYNRDKVMCSVLNMEHLYPPDVQLGRVLSIMLNCVFDTEVFEYLRGYCFHLLELSHGSITLPDELKVNRESEWLKTVPSRGQVESFWLGDE